jgi:hydroxycarboxylate dehydrogenase B
MSGDVTVQVDALTALIHEMVRLGGSEEEECRIVSEHLVGANLAGHDSHGIGIVATYINNLKRGLLVPNTPADCVHDDGPFLQFDGHKGYGQRVAEEVTEAAIARAQESGICVATLKNSHHIGRVGTYAEMVAAAGFVSIHFTNVTDHWAMVAPFGGAEARFGTNPVTMAMPTSNPDEPIILDMATSVVAMGKIRVAHDSGKQVPDAWIIDSEGQPSSDPGVMFRQPLGALRAFAEHKGYALCLMAELMSGALSGGGTLQPGHKRLDGIINTMTMIVMDPARLGDADWIKQEVDAMADYTKSAKPADPDKPVLVPGDPERAARKDRRANGIPIPERTWTGLLDGGELLGLERARALEISGLA